MSRPHIWRRLFGKPDGTLIRLRCGMFGHRWSICEDFCCDGREVWCDWCLGFGGSPPPTETPHE